MKKSTTMAIAGIVSFIILFLLKKTFLAYTMIVVAGAATILAYKREKDKIKATLETQNALPAVQPAPNEVPAEIKQPETKPHFPAEPTIKAPPYQR